MTAGNERTLPPEALDEWARAAAARLGLESEDIDIPLILDLARDVAHGIARPAAPLTAFLAGLAAGRAGGSREAVENAVSDVTDLAKSWSA